MSFEKEDWDWSKESWRVRGARVTDIVASASTGWEARRPTPSLSPDLLRDRFRGALPEKGEGIDSVLSGLDQLLPLCGYNGHPRWFGYITSSPDPIGVLGDYLASALNQNNNLWRIAPAATSIELQTLDWLKEIVGFPLEAEGVFSSGGQFANIIAHAVARNCRIPGNVRDKGLITERGESKRYRFYVSDQAHYCHAQALDLLGLGSDALRWIPVDAHYRMDLKALKERLEEDRRQGDIPLVVIATAGTVGVGAVDPIRELRELTRQENLWFHVDGAYGGPGVLASQASEDLRAISQADSLAFDPHKWLYAPIDAGVTLVREPGLLARSFGNQVSYLDQRTSLNGIIDFVNYTPENSRPFRALKVWLALKARGRNGFAESISRDFELAQMMEREISKSPDLKLAAPVSTSIVCWTVEPEICRSQNWSLEKRNSFQLAVLDGVEQRGVALLSKAVLKEGRIALRACFVNFRTTSEDVILTLAEVQTQATQLLRHPEWSTPC